MEHPSLIDRARRFADSIKARREIELSRCAKACFLDPDSGAVSKDGEKVLADLRKQARFFDSAIARNPVTGEIDRDELLRIEARRELALRLFNLLELGPVAVARLAEVDDGNA